MSVFTKLLLLVIFLSMLAQGALNKKNDENLHSLAHLRPRDIPPNPTKNTRYPSSGKTRAPLNFSFTGASGWFSMPSGTANTGSSFESSGNVPYPTKGAPYQNSTSRYTEQGHGEGENDQSGLGNQCPPQQTITLPPQTITLPAQTITMTPAPITINQAQAETVTVTVTPQTQTTTLTVWMTVTANQAPSCPSPNNAANPQIAPVAAPSAQSSNTPFAPVFYSASTPAIAPPLVTTPSFVVPLSTGDTAPILNTISPVIPDLGPTLATGPTSFPTNDQTSSVAQQASSSLVSPRITSIPIIAPYPYRNTTNQTFPLGSGSSRGFRSTGSGFAKTTNRHFSSYFLSKFVTETPISTIVIGPSPTREYFPGNGSSLLTPPSQANATVFQSTTGPTAPPSPIIEYFPDDGSSLLTPPTLANATASPTMEYFPDDGSSLLTPPAQANATASPTMEYFPDDGSSLLTPPAQANATSFPPMDGPTAPVVTPAVLGSSQTLAVVLGSVTSPPIIQSNTSISVPPVSTRIPPPPPSLVQPNTSISLPASTSSPQTPQPPPSGTPPLCTNGKTTQNITTDVRLLPPPHKHSPTNTTTTSSPNSHPSPPCPSSSKASTTRPSPPSPPPPPTPRPPSHHQPTSSPPPPPHQNKYPSPPAPSPSPSHPSPSPAATPPPT